MQSSREYNAVTELLHQNQEEIPPYFGRFFQFMRSSLESAGSEFGLGMTLFSLAVTIRASRIIEIGRFKGFSTLCLASALKFLEIDWQEPMMHKQRPDINYEDFEKPQVRKFYSIDPFPTSEATKLIAQAGLIEYVEFIDKRSSEVTFTEKVDLIFMDGDHRYDGCAADVLQYVPYLRPGGYFILHDYFGWYDEQNRNNSPIKRVADDLIKDTKFQHTLIDTGYQSFVIFRVPNPSTDL